MAMKKVVFIGDSLVEFFDWQKRLPAFDVVNFGAAGETTAGLKAKLPYIFAHVSDPDILLIMIGTNDVVMEDYGFINTYREVVETCKAKFTSTKIILTSLLPIKLPWFSDSAVPRVNDALKSIASESNVIYQDIYHLFLTDKRFAARDFFLEDGVHLSDRGYKCWADAVDRLTSNL